MQTLSPMGCNPTHSGVKRRGPIGIGELGGKFLRRQREHVRIPPGDFMFDGCPVECAGMASQSPQPHPSEDSPPAFHGHCSLRLQLYDA